MLVKVVRQNGDAMYQCQHVTTSRMPNQEGIEIDIRPNGPTVVLPRDALAVYIMNAEGDTVDSYRWPTMRKKETETS